LISQHTFKTAYTAKGKGVTFAYFKLFAEWVAEYFQLPDDTKYSDLADNLPELEKHIPLETAIRNPLGSKDSQQVNHFESLKEIPQTTMAVPVAQESAFLRLAAFLSSHTSYLSVYVVVCAIAAGVVGFLSANRWSVLDVEFNSTNMNSLLFSYADAAVSVGLLLACVPTAIVSICVAYRR
jgi:hypothetical protein